MKKFIKITFILPLFFLLIGCSNNPEATQAKKLEGTLTMGRVIVRQNDIDLGEIPILGGKVNIFFSFKNTGKDPIVLLEGTTSCMCTEAVVRSSDGNLSPRIRMRGHGALAKINQVLEPGERAKLEVTYDPLAHGPKAIGPIMRDVIIKTNSIKTPEIKFSFRGNVVP